MYAYMTVARPRVMPKTKLLYECIIMIKHVPTLAAIIMFVHTSHALPPLVATDVLIQRDALSCHAILKAL